MSDKNEPFDQEKFEITDQPIPKPAQSEAQRQWKQSAELNRIASLNYHTIKTLNDALEALRQKDPDKALKTIQDASAKYTRFGGPGPDPKWKPKTGEAK